MNDNIYFRPAIPFLICLTGGILLGSGIAGYDIGAMVAAIVGTGLCLWKIFRKKSSFFVPVVYFVFLGYLSIQPWVSPRLPANHILHYADSQRWNITGRVTNIPRATGHRTKFHLQVSSLDNGDRPCNVRGKLRVTVVGAIPDLSVGDRVRLPGRIRPLSNFKNPGGFDYKQYMAFKGIWASAYTNGDELAVIAKRPVRGVGHIIENVRSGFADLIDRSGHSQSRALLKALIIGDRSRISPETRQAFNRAGVGHLLAISGLHIGIVATVAFGLFCRLSTGFKAFLWRAWTRKAAALLSLVAVFVYGMIAGSTPSTQRAVIMVSVFLLTYLFERDQDPLNTLALAALVILIADPPSLFSISFQLSFAAVFAIIYGLSWVQSKTLLPKLLILRDQRSRFINRLISFFLVSLFAICGTLPLVAYYFNQVSIVGIGTNFIMVPLVGFLAIPIGLIALFVSTVSATAALWCIQFGCGILTVALEGVQFFADLPFAAVKTFTPNLLEIGCFYGLSWALLNLCRRPPDVATSPPHSLPAVLIHNPANCENSSAIMNSDSAKLRGKRRRPQLRTFLSNNPATIVLVLVLTTLSVDTCYWLYQRFYSPDLRVIVIDVGHGSASLLEFPGGYTMLIDGGGFADNSVFDVGATIIAPLLRRKKIRTVDSLILSHPNSDHLNGLIYIAKHFHVKKVWTNSETRNTLGYRKLREVITTKKIGSPLFAEMQRHYSINSVKLDFLYPPRGFLERKGIEKWRNTNNNSLVVKVSIGSISFLFPGDIMAAAETELVGLAEKELISTVLIAPHHGSRSSSSAAFLSCVDPEVVVISSGRQSRFKLPYETILERYKHLGYSIYRTDLNGAVYLSTGGRQLEIKPYLEF